MVIVDRDWNNADRRLLFQPPVGMNYSTDLWAPEMHRFSDTWYIIFTADPRGDSPPPETDMYCVYSCPAVNHRMFVLEGNGANPWTAEFSVKSQLDTYDQFAIDGTYFQHPSGLYHVYSCWNGKYDGWPANLCITKSRYLQDGVTALTRRSGKSLQSQFNLVPAPNNQCSFKPMGKDAIRTGCKRPSLIQRRASAINKPQNKTAFHHL